MSKEKQVQLKVYIPSELREQLDAKRVEASKGEGRLMKLSDLVVGLLTKWVAK